MTKRFLLGSAFAMTIGLAGCATATWHAEPVHDVTCLGMADVSLVEAIDAAERAQGQRVVDAEYNVKTDMGCLMGDPGHYDITFFRDGALSRAIVEADSGQVGPADEQGFFARLLNLEALTDWPQAEMRKGGRTASEAALTLPMAVRIAEANGGLALAAHVTTAGERTRYAVELVERGRMRTVYVAFDGTVSTQ